MAQVITLHKGLAVGRYGPACCCTFGDKKDATRRRDPPYFLLMRRGFTLSELLLILAVVGVLFGIGLPRLSSSLDRIEVGAAAGHIVAAHQRARLLAITSGRVLILSIDSVALSIRPRGEPAPLWSEPGPGSSRVSLAGPARKFVFSPEGFSLGLSNATLRLSRGAATRTVVISRLGRVRVTR